MRALTDTHALLHLLAPAADLLLHVVLLGALVLLAGLLGARTTQRRSPGLAIKLIRASLAAAMLIPLLTAALRIGVSPAWAAAWGAEGARRAGDVAVWVWVAGVALCLVRLWVSQARVRHVVSGRSRPVPASWQTTVRDMVQSTGMRAPRALVVPAARSPFVAGTVRPVLVLGEAHLVWGEEAVRATCAHELTHLQRRDPLWALVAGVVAALYWPLPLARAVGREMRLQSERICDEAALSTGIAPARYVRHLVAMATRRTDRPFETALGGSELLRRVEWIAAPAGSGREAPPAWAGLLVWGLLVTLGVMGLGEVAATPEAVFLPQDGPAVMIPGVPGGG